MTDRTNSLTDTMEVARHLPDAWARRVSTAMAGVAADARVVVAMSGGVDSSTVAALLRVSGYDVIGVTLQLYDHGKATGRAGSCCAGQDIHDARRVAATLGIPHYVLDYEARFRDRVVTPFVDSYRAGETPIPCIQCNSDVKFGDLLAMADELGAAALATGHYVQRTLGTAGFELHSGRDAARDQSYFLFNTTTTQLSRLVFPIGGFEKSEVRALARTLGIVVAAKPDSQDICFVPAGRYTDIIERLHPGAAEPGEIVHVDGRVLGHHSGIVHFTVGQRKGLGIATGEPLFVVRLDSARRRVVVGPRSALGVDHIHLRDLNWLDDRPLPADGEDGRSLWVKLRSSQPVRPATLVCRGGRTFVRLVEPEYGIASGQACAFYDSDAASARVLGGGWITSVGAERAG